MNALVDGTYAELTRGAYERLTGMSRSQAAYDLADLVEAHVLERIGSGRATRYRLPGPAEAQRRWTRQLIRTELDRFCSGRHEWPSASEFKAAGHWDLYVAASRYGGVKFWIAELGFPRTVRRPPRRLRSMSFATAGAAAGAVAVATGAFLLWPGARPSLLRTPDPKILVQEQVQRPPTKTRRKQSRVVPRAKRTTPVRSRPQPRTVVAAPTTSVAGAAAATPPPPPAAVTARAEQATPPPPPPPAGPVPMRAPKRGAGTPPPLPSP